jgi:hypothetical protein
MTQRGSVFTTNVGLPEDECSEIGVDNQCEFNSFIYQQLSQ